jgi:hypothetical protein
MREFAIDFEHRVERDEPRAVHNLQEFVAIVHCHRFNAWHVSSSSFWHGGLSNHGYI